MNLKYQEKTLTLWGAIGEKPHPDDTEELLSERALLNQLLFIVPWLNSFLSRYVLSIFPPAELS
jgi:hypothetical protein